MVQEVIHDWTHHIRENILANKVNWVLNNDNTEVDELMHDKSGDRIIMIKIGLTEMDVSIVNNWIKVAMFIQLKVCLEVNFEIFENQLDVTVVR